jgi:hypothetical protein
MENYNKIIIPQEEPKHPRVLSENGNELFFDEQGNLIKEEPKQETTVEEVAERLYSDKEYPMYGEIRRDGFINGAKWQQKKDIKELKPNPLLMDEVAHWDFRRQRSYSEEEVYNIIIDLLKRVHVGQIIDYGEIEEWFDTVKKK